MAKVASNRLGIDGKWVSTYKLDGVKYETQIHSAWSNMKGRCSARSKLVHPTYADCSIIDEWKDFQVFANWYSKQCGFGEKDDNGKVYQLDKDLLVHGNKVYGPDTCLLVPSALNSFLLDCGSARGACPKGVSTYWNVGKYRSYIRDNGKYVHLGVFDTLSDAECAYKLAKCDLLITWINRVSSIDYKVDPRLVGSLRTLLSAWQEGCVAVYLHDKLVMNKENV